MFVNDPRLVAEVFRKSKELDKDWRLMAPFSQARRASLMLCLCWEWQLTPDEQTHAPASAMGGERPLEVCFLMR